MKNRGFTLIEVMVTVMILAMTTTAAIKLVIMAQNTLSEVKKQESLLDAAQEVQAGVLTEELSAEGKSGDIRWKTEDKEAEMFGEDFGRLDFDRKTRGETGKPIRVKWRELTVSADEERKITLYMPTKEDRELQRTVNSEEGIGSEEDDDTESSEE